MKKLKPIHEIYLIAIWISIQVIVGTIIKREFITEDWEAQYYTILIVFAYAQVMSIVFYFLNKYNP